MNRYPWIALRRRALVVMAGAALTLSSMTGASAQMGGMKQRIMDDIATQLVSTIASDNCAQFEAMLKKKKSSSGSSSKGGAMLKSDPAARTRFVDKVAGPLLNKMIDCDLVPGR